MVASWVLERGTSIVRQTHCNRPAASPDFWAKPVAQRCSALSWAGVPVTP